MSVKVPWEFGVGLAVHDDRMALRADAPSDYTEREPVPSVPEAQNDGRLNVLARGTAPAPGTTLEVRTQRGGLVGGADPATMVWRESAGDWYGHEEQPIKALALVAAVGGGPAYTETKHPHAITLGDGRVLVAFQAASAVGTPYRVEVLALSPDGTRAIYTAFGQPTPPAGDGWRPCLALEPSGRVLLYSWAIDTGAETAQIRMHYSDDDGQTWAQGADSALPDQIDVSSSGYSTRRIRAAAVDGGVVMLVQLVAATGLVSAHRDQIWQYASRNFGCSFVKISETDETDGEDALKAGVAPDIIQTRSGAIVAAWIAPETKHLYARRLANPFDALFDAPPVVIANDADRCVVAGTPALATDYELGLCQDHGGAVVVTTKIPTTAGRHAQQLHRSDDDGRTWSPIGYGSVLGETGGLWWRGHTAGFRPDSLCLAALDGRFVALGNHVSTTTTLNASLAAYAIGQPSTVTLPPFNRGDFRRVQVCWEYTFGGFGSPADGGYTVAAGLGTETVGTEYVEISTTANSYDYTDTLPATSTTCATNGAILDRTVHVTSGGSLTTDDVVVVATVEDTTSQYAVKIRLTADSARILDHVAGTTLATISGTLATDVPHEWRIAIADGKASVWHRPYRWDGKERWVNALDEATVSDGGAAGASQAVIQYGHVASSTATSRWYSHGAAHDIYSGQQLLSGPLNPEDTAGRPWSPAGVPVGSAATIVSAQGATYRGDEWHIVATSETPVANLTRGGPRKPWRSSTLDLHSFAFDVNGGSGAGTLTDVMAVAGFGCNFRRIEIYGKAGAASAVLLASVDLADGMQTLKWTASGDRVEPDTSAGVDTDTPTFALGELAGCYFADDSKQGYAITRNRSGRWTTTAARNRVRLYLDDPTGLGASGTDGAIVPKDWCVLIDMRGDEYDQIRIDILAAGGPSTQITPPEGYWQIGRLIVGSMVTSAYHPSWGNRVSEEFQREMVEARDGQRSSVRLGPTRRRFRIGWVDGVRQYNVIGVNFDEDGDWFVVSDDAGSQGMGQVGLVLQSMAGLLEATDGASEPVALLPYVPAFESSVSRFYLANRREQVALTYIDSPIVRDRVVGQTMHGTLIRGEVIEMTESV